jgi:hypothetical protein
MPGLALHIGMEMHCPHGGLVTIAPAGPPSVVLRSPSMPALTAANVMTVTGCASVPPCTAVQWANVSSSVQIHGQPLLTQAPPPAPPPVPGGGVCAGSVPPAPPLVVAMQLSVTAR